MKNRLLTLVLASLALFSLPFIACHKDAAKVTTTGSSTGVNMTDEQVTASVQGRVVDENGLPMQGASVTSGSATTTTDVNGVFSFSNISMSSRFGYVKVTKADYFTGSRSIIIKAGESSFVTIKMIPRNETGNFAANIGGTVTVGSGNSAAFTASSVVTASTSAAYTGTVHVFASYLDPTDSLLSRYMPGDLRGIDSSGKEVLLQSFGMLLVELQGDGGEKLQLASGSTATLTWAIPAKLLSVAPATLPLWYFNDSTGKWMQQGTAVKTGSSYVGKVGHFSYWNCDVAVPKYNFQATFKDQNGNPLANMVVELNAGVYGVREGFTDANGFVEGPVPADQTIVMFAETFCGGILAKQTFGPLMADINLGTLTISMDKVGLTLTGTVVDCSSNPVDSGTVMLSIDGLSYGATVKQGAFSISFTRCQLAPSSLTYRASDLNALTIGASASMTVDTGTVDLGVISACGQTADQYVTFSYNGSTYSYTNANYDLSVAQDLQTSRLVFTAYPSSGTGFPEVYFYLYGSDVTGTGTYDVPYFSYEVGRGNSQNILGAGMTCTITNWAPAGGNQYMIGTLGGNMYDSISNSTHPVAGSFKMMRY